MSQTLYYDEVHPDKVSPEDYVSDPHVRMMTWGHYATKEKTLPPVEQVVTVSAGDQTWSRPSGIGVEAALYVKRLDGVESK